MCMDNTRVTKRRTTRIRGHLMIEYNKGGFKSQSVEPFAHDMTIVQIAVAIYIESLYYKLI